MRALVAVYEECEKEYPVQLLHRRRIARSHLTPQLDHPSVVWRTEINLKVVWGLYAYQGNYKMYHHRLPVRLHTPQTFKYTFRDQDRTVIDLTGYLAVFLLVKKQGTPYATAEAEFDGDRTLGKARYLGYTFLEDGSYSVQFVAIDPAGFKVYGDPALLNVAENIDDLGLDELPAQ